VAFRDNDVVGCGKLVNIASLTSTRAEPPEWPKQSSEPAGARSKCVQEGESITSRVNKRPKAKGVRRMEGCRSRRWGDVVKEVMDDKTGRRRWLIKRRR
jgi:hypothetical protein